MKTIDNFLNSITMYTLMVYGLGTILAAAVLFSSLGKLPISDVAIIVSAAVILTVCFIADRLLPIVFNVAANKYSSLITSLILCLIMPPTTSLHRLALLGLAGLIAITSKYLLVYHYKHLFNPAALAALILGLSGLLPAIWWIGSPVMLPLTAIFGVLVLRKVRRFKMFGSFLLASLIVAVGVGLHHDQTIGYIISTLFRSSPLVFLGTVMLTEPSTSPPRLRGQLVYGLIVGVIFTSELRFGSVSATPEMSLIIGNILAYIISPKYKLRLSLKRREQLAPQIYDFSFSGAGKLNFIPGQYLEWTLPQNGGDGRGNRRVFSIASEPGGDEIHLTTKFTDTRGSSYKKQLLDMRRGDLVLAGQLAGDFVLPKDVHQKLVLIAGGIGITPYVSMVKTMIKTNQKRDIVLIYLVAQAEELCYHEVWQDAEALGVKLVPILSSSSPNKNWAGQTGYLTDKILRQEVPDYKQRHYYISGPPGLVANYSKLLTGLKIKLSSITVDHFSGY